VWVVLFALLLGAAPAASDDPAEGLRALLASPALRGARVGVAVIDLESGEPVLLRHAERPMVPASNQKLIVAAAALAHWGPAYRFETPVFIDGKLAADGTLLGTLWIEGAGDPSLVSESLWKLAEEVRLRGIEKIRGGIGVDPSYFDGLRFHPDWEPLSARAYHAPTGAFAANYSSFRVEVIPAVTLGGPARVRIAPGVPYLRPKAVAVTLGEGGRARIEVEPLPDGSGDRVRVSGSVPAGDGPQTYWRAVSQPERYAAEILRAQLQAQGIAVSGSIRIGKRPPDAVELLRFEGEALRTIVERLNKFSNNFIADQLVKNLGAARFGPPGSWRKGREALNAYLRGLGIDERSVVLADGSGLSPRNRVSPALLVRVIRDAARRFSSGPEFLASLPLAGLDGTLEDRMDEAPRPLRGKTGHLRHVSSLSGVFPDPSGRRLAFALIVNGARGGGLEVDAAIDAFLFDLGAPPLPAAQGSAGD
jgi:D-alanyl-D-alanine carboxypeptidase/D-alanyl-D-alanine-endopeptidase (penicillin-binding protein 4)